MNRHVLGMLVLIAVASAAPVALAERDNGGDPSNSAAARAFQASYTAESAGNYAAALAALDQLPGPERLGYFASMRRGWLQYCLGRYADSVSAYALAVKREPNTVEARVALLLPLMAQAKWKDVIKAAQDVLKHDPQNYLALQRMAYAQFSSQHFPEAEQLYRRLVHMYPSDVEMRVGLGWAALRTGKQPEALELFRSVLELSPKHASALAGLQAAAPHSATVY